MLKFSKLPETVLVFDAEWVPDEIAFKLTHPEISASLSTLETYQLMWKAAGATEEHPRPFIKLALSRLISLAAVIRTSKGKTSVSLSWDFAATYEQEKELIERFLGSVGMSGPLLVGFNHVAADLAILTQRGIQRGVQAKDFCARPGKPWEGRDYFAKYSDWLLDLYLAMSLGGSKGSPSLHEMCVLSGIPGKLGTSGADVVDLWVRNRFSEISVYNRYDALSTYLLFLRMCLFKGAFTEREYYAEQMLLLEHLVGHPDWKKGDSYLGAYVRAWSALQKQLALPFAAEFDKI